MAETTTKTHGITAGPKRFRLSWAGVTDVGLRRDTNQDSFFAEYPLFIVADGMGGHAGGEIASQRTIARLEALLDGGEVSRERIESALELVVGDIAAHPETTDEGTGTTLTGVFLESEGDDAHWVALNIGDSRVYLLRDDRLVQVTTDHSVVQELIAAGKISPDEAEGHPYSNVITRAVGASELTAPDYVTIDVRDGDRFVICSDGLTKELTDYGIQHFLKENADPGAAVDAMLAAALENGGRDNVTLVIVQVDDDSSSTDAPSEQ
ncbi:serine/threonine protein phosphatase PrpC [Microbacterium natoriense]|uniref:Serine/threonine protein phosphatase PrpC n=1 Tax=Microbacterium natoriense TaxID=284570 RepID=A0AAW8EWJ4_9MICO|nr:protein phosphatase 2C domain-containing protein [Microbacterium natoriense]MDQ0647906.1 serine/threonine protein phosphatase PrpC [Microbacterium natoriense]